MDLLGRFWKEEGEPNPDCSTVPPMPLEKDPEGGEAGVCPNTPPEFDAKNRKLHKKFESIL